MKKIKTLASSILFSLGLLSLTGSVTLEHQVKVIFIFNFANFVEWPEPAFENKKAPLKICLYGNVPFSDLMMKMYQGAPVRDRITQISTYTKESALPEGCNILYVGLDKGDELEDFFSNLNHMFILSVGNADDFLESGGMLNILRTSDQAKFEIDLKKFEIDLNRAVLNGLNFSSDLLELVDVINN